MSHFSVSDTKSEPLGQSVELGLRRGNRKTHLKERISVSVGLNVSA